jgi:hypothetical protein
MDGANGIDIVGKFPQSASRPFRRERYKSLIKRAKKSQRQQRFYLAVAEPSLPSPKSARHSPPGHHRNGLAKGIILP